MINEGHVLLVNSVKMELYKDHEILDISVIVRQRKLKIQIKNVLETIIVNLELMLQ